MADNVTFQSTVLATPPDGTIAATDEVGGRHYQLIKQAFGADGAATLVSASDPLPVTATLTEPISVDDNGSSLTVDGTVTVQDGGGAITVDNAGTFATQATLQTADNTVGRVKITDGTDVADVLDLANTNPLTVAIVDGSGSQITSFGGSGGTAEVDDSAFTAATDSGTPIMGFVTADSVDSGDVGVLGMLANRQLKVTLFDSSGVELSVGGGTQYTEDAAAAANPVGNAIIVVRDDDRGGSLTSTDGDNIALRGTDAGEVYVKHVDDINAAQSGTWNIADITGTVSLPTGAATSAKQDTIIGHVDGIEGLLTTIDGDTGNIVTSVQLLDDTVFAEDVAAQAADKGISILAVRRDADTSLVGTDNDYANLQVDANGALKVEIFDGGNSHTVDNNGTFAVQAAQSGTWNITDISGTVSLPTGASTAAKQDTIIGHLDGVEGLLTTIDTDTGNIVTSVQLLDDTVFAEDVAAQAADKGIAILAVRRDADTSLVGTDNDYANLQVNATGALKVEIFDGGDSHTIDGTVTIQDGGNTITVDNGGTFAVQDATAQASLSVIDDWDESDRAKVNPIVGQAGVAGGHGTVGATTQRVVWANATGLATTQNALSTTAEEVIASNSSRQFAEVKNADDAINVYLGDDGTVTAANGHLLRPGEAFSFERYTGAIFAIAASGTPTVTTIEW